MNKASERRQWDCFRSVSPSYHYIKSQAPSHELVNIFSSSTQQTHTTNYLHKPSQLTTFKTITNLTSPKMCLFRQGLWLCGCPIHPAPVLVNRCRLYHIGMSCEILRIEQRTFDCPCRAHRHEYRYVERR